MTLGLRALAVAVAVAAGLVMLVPLEASYRGSRSVEYHPAPFRLTHEARCGAPVMSLLGTDPVVAADSYSAYPNAAALACHAPAWKRVNTGLLLLGLLAGGAAVTAHGARRFGADDALTSSTPA